MKILISIICGIILLPLLPVLIIGSITLIIDDELGTGKAPIYYSFIGNFLNWFEKQIRKLAGKGEVYE